MPVERERRIGEYSIIFRLTERLASLEEANVDREEGAEKDEVEKWLKWEKEIKEKIGYDDLSRFTPTTEDDTDVPVDS